MILTGVGFKLSLVPFHMWTPDIYEGAPAPITGFVAVVSKIAVFAVILRYFILAEGHADASLRAGPRRDRDPLHARRQFARACCRTM